MCGRAAQTFDTVRVAAHNLGAELPIRARDSSSNNDRNSNSSSGNGNNNQNNVANSNASANNINAIDYNEKLLNDIEQDSSESKSDPLIDSKEQVDNIFDATNINSKSESLPRFSDNFNLSPGMDAIVIWYDSDNQKFLGSIKKWGLVTRSGHPNAPLSTSMSLHFESMMFNARSETLYEKHSFANLALNGKTCVIAVDGFFEWKKPSNSKEKKQPYYIYRNNKNSNSDGKEKHEKTRPSYLLMAGLWTSVSTGREEDPLLSTFTILTTDVCPCLKWLHTRMPVCIWNDNNNTSNTCSLAKEWLVNPSQKVLKELVQQAQKTPSTYLKWHAVTTQMSNTKFRSVESIKPLPPIKTVSSFFSAKTKSDDNVDDKTNSNKKSKNKVESVTQPSTNNNLKSSDGSITAFLTSQSPSKKRTASDSSAPDSKVSKKNANDQSSLSSPTNKKGTLLNYFTPNSK